MAGSRSMLYHLRLGDIGSTVGSEAARCRRLWDVHSSLGTDPDVVVRLVAHQEREQSGAFAGRCIGVTPGQPLQGTDQQRGGAPSAEDLPARSDETLEEQRSDVPELPCAGATTVLVADDAGSVRVGKDHVVVGG